ncbi:haloacid dehalogenase-like hydrolase domain-containing protein 3 [Hyla sarda]|uniref:haloacid dehalogenase-like hydrolase domain-containing protein 3 n=1 Tax=Hyla sarda TaxID=327740 RepID=UPI0024C2DB35|nr:haloacid dehalogenase-like hydrolase domain-containing protein 3 [Hyla sarda]XP_056396445.1 haloacid dehalogenase-like hydrolase domain-containing protein 3 [Hyla sarda]XP_056396446.1 haloacid dehalogenase-like hydrolase domain-containing protein 3 [Hyla sarda]XP_056396447.1 haloacid dehalogenase-like hydrolase domain-containing protein 3 [Hyla sarda]XP_056396448.1 haloacid dehalogenase-like hydrolase domain-containing protein 3 [Hyla sarda]
MKLRLLTWDVKDTLLRLRLPVGQQYQAEAKSRGLQVDSASLESSFRQVYRNQCRMFPNYGLGQGMTSHRWWLDVVSQTFRLSGVQNEKILQPLAEKLYQDFRTDVYWEVLPGAREALKGCGELGLKMAVISNFDRRLEDILRNVGLDGHFDFVLTSESSGVAKPDLAIFHKALKLGGVIPQHAAHIGDDYINDYKAARQVGMFSFLLQRHLREDVPSDHVIQSLDQLIPKLRGLMK